ncbi:TetR/AcrR family transcriptional regulator [Nocardia yunnanensis]|uniref:TetR/AcrR family transcriptional regulator n=2 Tax=Nocardia yunnanensis TaxID=2382165 RepID=A0A386ZNT8_9NOCA|nr:TetR/AcrR family transcriptional regulator [Nocardia yunnanensis]
MGFGRARPEHVCERAGYTRGAFYSNFASMDELFLAMWARQSERMLAARSAVLEQEPVTDIREVRQVVEHVLDAVPLDDKWFRIIAEFSAHAVRHPELRAVIAERERAISAGLTPVVERLLARLGRRVTDPHALGMALAAVHDGTETQCLMEPDNLAVHELRVDLIVRVVLSYSVPVDDAAATES